MQIIEEFGIIFLFFIAPITIAITSVFLLRLKLSLVYKSLLLIIIIILNDLIWKRLAWSYFEEDSLPVANISLILGVLVAVITVFVELKFIQKKSFLKALVVTLTLPILISFYFFYFWSYGFIYSLPESDSMRASRESKAFINKLNFSDDTIAFESDTIFTLNGWSEKDRKLNHKGLAKKEEYSKQVDYIIEVSHNNEEHPFAIYCTVNSRDINGAAPVNSIMKFKLSAYEPLEYITFFRISDRNRSDTLIKEVKINFK